jgi:hypothetical protein
VVADVAGELLLDPERPLAQHMVYSIAKAY